MAHKWGKNLWGKGPWGGPGLAYIPPPSPVIGAGIGWGLEHHGIDPYGSARALEALTMQHAVAVSLKQVMVTLSTAAQAIVATLPGDALNPATWVIQRLDTNAFLNVIAVTSVTPSVYILTTIQPFGPTSVMHRVSSTTLRDIVGSLIQQPNSADFLGIASADNAFSAVAARRQVAARDIANPQTPVKTGLSGGTLVVTAGGDYATETGAALIRKLVTRRIISTPGDFFHAPEYGVGIPRKEPIPASELVKLRTRIEQQVKTEPEVDDASASITLDANNIMTVSVRVRVKKTGEPVDVSLPIPTAGIAL